jgi:hypothetical protein
MKPTVNRRRLAFARIAFQAEIRDAHADLV